MVFNPGGSTGRLHACPFLGTWRALLCGWARLDAVMVVAMAGAFFWQKKDLGIPLSRIRYKQLLRNAVDRCFLRSQTGLNMPCQYMRAGRMSGCQGTPWSKGLDSKELHGEAWW